MARNYKRDARGRFARVASKVGKRRAAKDQYRRTVTESRAMMRGELNYVKRNKYYRYGTHIGDGVYAVNTVKGSKIRADSRAGHRARVRAAKVNYRNAR